MSESLRLYGIAASPNNMKVRIALAYKGLPYEQIPVDSHDRSAVIELSGQPLTPVLAHGDRVVFDSAAILRYLDANFRRTPPLFSPSYETMKEIETWERFGRGDLVEPVGITFRQYFSPQRDPSETGRASRLLHGLTAKIEERLGPSRWLVGDAMTAADVTAAPAVYYGMLPPEVAESGPIMGFFFEHLKLGNARDRTREWVHRVMAYDR